MLPNFHFSIERWRKNEEYGVWVSTHGRIRLIKNKEFLNPRINDGGYCIVFTDKGAEYVHRLVAYTWLGGKRNAKYNVDHINSNKRDNSVRNLRWIEQELNLAYAAYTYSNEKVLDELPPIPAIERTEDLLKTLYNPSIKKEKRGRILLELMSIKAIEVYMDDERVGMISETLKRKLGAQNTKNNVFAGGIINSCMNKVPYCTKMWKVRPIKENGSNEDGNETSSED